MHVALYTQRVAPSYISIRVREENNRCAALREAAL